MGEVRNARPLAKALCVTKEIREVVALEKGVLFENLSEDMMEEIKNTGVERKELDPISVFLRPTPAKKGYFSNDFFPEILCVTNFARLKNT